MSRRYRKSRRDPGLIEIATTSDWKVSAAMSLVCVVGAAFVIPALFGSSRVLGALVPMLSAFAWLFACVFGAISLFRFMKEQAAGSVPSSEEKPTKWSREVIDRIEWKRFEDLCCEFYRVLGIRAETTALGADGGVDVRLFQDDTDPQAVSRHARAIARSVGPAFAALRDCRRLDDPNLPELRRQDGRARRQARTVLGVYSLSEVPGDDADAGVGILTEAMFEDRLAYQ